MSLPCTFPFGSLRNRKATGNPKQRPTLVALEPHLEGRRGEEDWKDREMEGVGREEGKIGSYCTHLDLGKIWHVSVGQWHILSSQISLWSAYTTMYNHT